MTAPRIPVLPTPPSLTTAAGEFAERADGFLAALPEFGSKMNDLGIYTEQRASEVDTAKTAAETARTQASSSAAASASAASAASQQRQQAEIAASAARSAAGLPAIAGNARKRLSVNAAGNGVEWISASAVVDVFDVSGTFTKSPDDQMYHIELWGGGGGGASALSSRAGGGSGGEYLSLWIRAEDVPASVPVTVGAGGAGRAEASNGGGYAGGSTSFGDILVALGGNAGAYGGYFSTPPRSATATAPASAPMMYFAASSGYGSYGSAPGGNAKDGGAGGGGAYANSQEYAGGTSARAGDGGRGSRVFRVAAGDGGVPAGGGGGGGYYGAGGAGGHGRAIITRLKF